MGAKLSVVRRIIYKMADEKRGAFWQGPTTLKRVHPFWARNFGSVGVDFGAQTGE
jgi:hypothetical protein